MIDDQVLIRLVEVVRAHAPPVPAGQAALAASLALVVGALIGLYGLWLGRLLVCMGFTVCGAVLGWQAATRLGLPAAAGGTAGGAIGALVGLVGYRLWVGLLSAALLTAVALGVYTARVAVPELGAFERSLGGADGRQIVLPAAAEQYGNLHPQVGQRLRQLWGFLEQRVPGFRSNVQLIGLAGAAAGLLVGFVWPRVVMAVWLSLVGALISAGGALGLMGLYRPDWFEGAAGRPTTVALVIGAMWVVGLLMQARQVVGRKAAGRSDNSVGKS